LQSVVSSSQEHLIITPPPMAPPSKSRYRPHKRIHANWHKQSVDVDGTEHVIYDVPAIGPAKADILVMSGCGADSLSFTRKINSHFSPNGIRTLATQQAHKSVYADNIERNLNYVDWLLTNPDSPVHMRDKSRPLFVLTNSSTAMLMDHVSLDRHKANIINQNVSYFFDTAPFFDTARTSIIHEFQEASAFERMKSNILSEAYGRHAMAHPDVVIGDHWKDRAVMRMLGSKKTMKSMTAEIAGATHGEGIAYREMGRHLVRQLEQLKRAEPDHPIFQKQSRYYLGTDDPAACNRTARYVAAVKGQLVSVFEANAEHNPFKQDQNVAIDMLKTINQRTAQFYMNQTRIWSPQGLH
jgi:hypothetical protein